jgi:outer membrane protein assembly factor BamB
MTGRMVWIRRMCFAAVLLVAAVTPGPASGWASSLCRKPHCETAGTVRWARALPGTWVAQPGLSGTVPVKGEAYAAVGSQVDAVGAGLTVSAFSARTGQPLWTSTLTGFPAGSAITSVRVWPGVVTAGVALAGTASGGAAGARAEVVLRATSGQRMRAYPAAPFGGAVAAGPATTVIVGAHAVTCYLNRTGKVAWSRPTGSSPQAWQVDGGHLYVAVAAGGYLGTAPVTALRRIDLRTGAQRLVRPPGRAFAGSLSMAFDGVVLFSGNDGVAAYSGTTGVLLWRKRGALPDTVDAAAQRFYLIAGNLLLGVDPQTGTVLAHVPGAAAAASSGLYGVREGAVLGLDHGALGKAWGYDAATQQVLWTSRPLPWPHFFVDLSGIGGSAPPGQDVALLAICARLGPALPHNAGQRCLRPQLAALNR